MRISDWSSDVCSSDLTQLAWTQWKCLTARVAPCADPAIHLAVSGGLANSKGQYLPAAKLLRAHLPLRSDSVNPRQTPPHRCGQEPPLRWLRAWRRGRIAV